MRKIVSTPLRRFALPTLLVGMLTFAYLIIANPTNTAAVTAGEWQAGSIVSDDLFYDNNSMTTTDIQTFLNGLVPSCDTNGTQPATDKGYPGLTHAQYAAQVGLPGPPYVCVKDYYQVPRSDIIVDNFSGNIPSDALSAAQIIKSAADTYRVSPRTLLVKLRLESKGPVLLDSWPVQSQYTAAMGYACNDTSPCDPQYAGFYNQVTNAARQIRLYYERSGTYRYKPFQANTIYYNPGPCKTWSGNNCAEWYGAYKTDRDITYCGSSSVTISNYATAGLYNYTPYQPNQAALNNLYGTGDGCSTYGNRNFWTIWNDWFGPSNTPFLRSWQTGKMYIRSESGALYYITDANQLRDLGYGTGVLNGFLSVDDSYITSRGASDLPALVQFGNQPEVYYYANGQLHYVNYATYQAYGSPFVGTLSLSFKTLFTMGSDATGVLRDYIDGSVYYSQNGSRRYVVGPAAYDHYNLSTITTSTASRSLISAINEGAPLAKPGLVVYGNNSSYAGVVSEDGNHLYPINTDLRYSLQLQSFSTDTRLLKLLPEVSGPITALAKDASGNLYILDQNFKQAISPAQKVSLGFSDEYYTLAPSLLLNQMQTRAAHQGAHIVAQSGGSASTYLLDQKQMVLFQSQYDLANYGYSLDDRVSLTKRFTDTYFSFNNATVIPAGILSRASNDQRVYLSSPSGQKVPITSSYLFTNIGFSFSSVRVVTPQSLERMNTTPQIAPYAVDTAGQRWLLYNGQKRLVPPLYQADYNLAAPAADNQITSWQLSALPRTYNASNLIRIDNSPNVYLIEGGQSHLLSRAAYLSISTNLWNDITPVSSDLFSLIPSGAPRT